MHRKRPTSSSFSCGFHSISTAFRSLAPLMLCFFLLSCGKTHTKDGASHAPHPGLPSTKKKASKAPRKETPSELSFRLYLTLKKRDPGAKTPAYTPGPPLLTLHPEAKIRAELQIVGPGERRSPTQEELIKIKGLGLSIDEILSRNLIQRLPHADIKGFGNPKDENMRAGTLDMSRAATEALILIPDFWKSCRKSLGKRIYVGMPSRTFCLLAPASSRPLLVWGAELSHPLFTDGSQPIARGYLEERGGIIVAGPSFEDLLR